MIKHPRVDDGTDNHEDFRQRWSRRKAAAGGSHEPESVPEPQAADPAPSPEPPAKTDADMPAVESIDESTDMSDFFSPQVSDKLRQVALRKLFHLPQFNVVDGLDDYDDDFTAFEALGEIVTADMRHRMELEQDERAASEAADVSGENALEDEGRTAAGESGEQDQAREQAAEEEAREAIADAHDPDAHDSSVENDDEHRDA